MSFTKTYYLCPTSDFIHPPPTGPISLGSIIRSTSAPQFPLNRTNIVPVANGDPPVVETDWKRTISAKTTLGLGVYAQFLKLATGGYGLGPEIDVEQSSETASRFAFDSIKTLAFEPTLEYVKEAIKAPAVQAWLKEPRQRFAPVVSLFLITGMKLVQGAKIQYTKSESIAVRGNIGIDVAPLGMTFGPKGTWSTASDDGTDFSRDSGFVFAFRVKKLRFGRKLKLKEHNKGAFLTIGNNKHDGVSVLVEDVDASTNTNATRVPDVAENGDVYCIPG